MLFAQVLNIILIPVKGVKFYGVILRPDQS